MMAPVLILITMLSGIFSPGETGGMAVLYMLILGLCHHSLTLSLIHIYSEYDRQARLLAMIHQYDQECRGASERGGDLNALFSIPAREKIGRAKSVPADLYKDSYANLLVEMEEEISAIAEKGEDAL